MSNPMSICVCMGEQPDINSKVPLPKILDQGETSNQKPSREDGPIRIE